MRGLVSGLMIVLLAASGAQAQVDVMPNGGFEDSDIGDGWHRTVDDGNGVDYSIVPYRIAMTGGQTGGCLVVGGGVQRSGDKAAEFESLGWAGDLYLDQGDDTFHIPVKPGGTIDVEFWGQKSVDIGDGRIEVSIRQYDAAHTPLEPVYDDWFSPVYGDDYVRWYIPGGLLVEADCQYINVELLGNGRLTCLLDDISVIQRKPEVWPDADKDGDVDQTDFAMFQRCHTGGGTFTLSDLCSKFDRDKDLDVDETDYGEFKKCATGPSVLFHVDPPAGCDLGP